MFGKDNRTKESEYDVSVELYPLCASLFFAGSYCQDEHINALENAPY